MKRAACGQWVSSPNRQGSGQEGAGHRPGFCTLCNLRKFIQAAVAFFDEIPPLGRTCFCKWCSDDLRALALRLALCQARGRISSWTSCASISSSSPERCQHDARCVRPRIRRADKATRRRIGACAHGDRTFDVIAHAFLLQQRRLWPIEVKCLAKQARGITNRSEGGGWLGPVNKIEGFGGHAGLDPVAKGQGLEPACHGPCG